MLALVVDTSTTATETRGVPVRAAAVMVLLRVAQVTPAGLTRLKATQVALRVLTDRPLRKRAAAVALVG